MMYFKHYSELTAALAVPGTKFLPPFTTSHGFHCARCKQDHPFREGLIPGYATWR